MTCRHCGAVLSLVLVDLGEAPPSNAYLTADQLTRPEKRYPLRVLVCETCWLVQTEDFAEREELFDADYAYFSGYSATWSAHVAAYVDAVVERFDLGRWSHVVELASNDGTLLEVVQDRGIPCLGIEPTASAAAAARSRGLAVVERFFGTTLADELARSAQADLIVANNVLAHVPDINDFVRGCAELLKPGGVVTFEFPHLKRLIDEAQFDTIYHEHYSYLSFNAAARVLAANRLEVFDVEPIEVHGGSLRVFAQRADSGRQPRETAVDALLADESSAGMADASYYEGFQARADRIRDDFAAFLAQAREERETVVGYGAAAKGNTLLNYAGAGPDDMAFVADRNPAKVGRYLPGSRIPIVEEAVLRRRQPRYVVILPWNLRSEIANQLADIASWGGRLLTAVPHLEMTG